MNFVYTFAEKYPSYASCKSTLTESSVDDNTGEALVESSYEIVDFDDVADIHMKVHTYKGAFPSVDAFYIDNSGIPYFIEFKNGKNIKNDEINHKACSSILIACDINMVPSFSYVKQRGIHIIVYNKLKQPNIENYKINAWIRKLSKRECRLQQAKNLDWLFAESFSYNQDEFDAEFIKKVLMSELVIHST